MNAQFVSHILEASGAQTLNKIETLQRLWSGYGEISRYQLSGSKYKQLVIKHVKLPKHRSHPRGWNSQRAHQRKQHSYQVECAWYRDYSPLCDDACRVAKCLGSLSTADEYLLIMEDLLIEGFPRVKENATLSDMNACLSWLANFHARFMGRKPESLWPTGTYWHLDTRPDELDALQDQSLKRAASDLDQVLASCPYQTLVHGDAKLANFCFSHDAASVAAVDFQYVGAGCGMKDLAYFIGSCLASEDCAQYEAQLLDLYFDRLKHALYKYQPSIEPKQLEASWRPLFAVAWADFQRFLKGWSPEHWKIHPYSERQTQLALQHLNQVDAHS